MQMKFAKIQVRLAVAFLVAVSLLAVPALSWPGNDNPGGFGQGPMFAMKNNLTAEELDNMTLGELKEMQWQSRNCTSTGNASVCPFRADGQNMNESREMSRSCKMNEMGQASRANEMGCGSWGCAAMREGPGGYGPMSEQCDRGATGCNKECNKECRRECSGSESRRAFSQDSESSRCGKAFQAMPRVSPVLLMNDLTLEDLQNMTLNEIRSLVQEKMQELDNMTLSEARQLVQTRLSEKDNMTISELKEESRNMRQISRIIEFMSSGNHIRD
jgi:hypothetical protein